MEPDSDDRTEQREAGVSQSDVSSDLGSSTELQTGDVEEREHLRVYLRIRPFTSGESSSGEAQSCVSVESADTVLLKAPLSAQSGRQSTTSTELHTGQRFQFSQVYGPDTSQKQLYDGTVKDLVRDVLTGANSLVFTYGVTNAGKTFTFLGPEADAGLLPRSLSSIFNSIEGHICSDVSIKPHRCREVTRLSKQQQLEQILLKRSLFKQCAQDRNTTLLNSTLKTQHEGDSAVSSEDRVSLGLSQHTRFSVWVSFCEIYKENIHDLLEPPPNSSQRRTVLRLSQDVKGHSFVKDLRWVHVDSAEEAYRVLHLGKRNQSCSSTKLNQLSSRSHSIFSVRILRLEDVGTQRVSAVSELCLCDLAGSERCAKTQNQGERLKEAGNINSSLHILGKCITALRHNQQAKLLQHVPFRESKLTHYLQSFLCGRGRACMIVNINQSASVHDETLNVLRFSAVAQKVVVLNSKSQLLLPERWSSDVSLLLDSCEEQPKKRRRRRSELSVWDCSLEDVQEDAADELEDTTQCSSLEESSEHHDKILISKKIYQSQVALLEQLQLQLKQELADSLGMESRIREEISREVSHILSSMQQDYNDRLARERDILEERAEKRLEIFKNLSQKLSGEGHDRDSPAMDPFTAELAEMENYPEAYLSGAMGERSHAFDRLEEHVSKYSGDSSGQSSERASLMKQLQEKSFQVSALEKQVSQLQRSLEQSALEPPPTAQLQQAQAAADQEKRAKEEALSALKCQTSERLEALASLEAERKERQQAQRALSDLQNSHRDTARALQDEKRSREEERRAKEKLLTTLEEERSKHKSQHHAEEQLAALAEKNKAKARECEELRAQVHELKSQLQAAGSKVSSETQRNEQVSAQLQAAQKQLDQLSSEVKDKAQRIHVLTQEADRAKQELQTSVSSASQLKDELSQLRANLASEKEHNKRKSNQITHTEQELVSTREQLALEKLMSEQKLAELNEKLRRHSASKEETEHLRRKLVEREKSLDDVKTKLELLEKDNKQLRVKLEEEARRAEKSLEQDASGKLQMDALQKQLVEQQAASDQLLCDAKLQLYEQQGVAEKLRADLELANGKCAALQEYNAQTDGQASRMREMERTLEDRDRAHKEKLSEERRRAQKEMEAKEKELVELRDQRERAESEAVQETRRKEAERRRELLAKAEEAIAHKDAELDKKNAEISRLKLSSQQDVDKVKSLSTELQRREEHSNELQEKMADYKKQLQQVQKEISSMREEERSLKQRLNDLDKSKKQLQSDLATKERTIASLKMEQSSNKSEQLHQNTCKELEAKAQVMEQMRLALLEQEETQEQMERVMEQKDKHMQELTTELEKLKAMLLRREAPSSSPAQESSSTDLRAARQEASQAQLQLQSFTEKHRSERKTWMEEKLSLIAQAKEAEERRNQDMRRFAEDRDKFHRQQTAVESLSSQLTQKEQTMEQWRKERDTLVSALEVQLQKLLSSQAQKEKLIQELQQKIPQPPAETDDGGVAELQAILSEREAEIVKLKEELQSTQDARKIKSSESPKSEAPVRKSRSKREPRTSVISQSSAGCPSVLDSSEISTENGRTSRFPKPELEISFSPLQPNRMALRRQGEESGVTVKITRSARKRKSNEMDKNNFFRRSKRRATMQEVEAENRRNTRNRTPAKQTPLKEEKASPYGRHDSQSSVRGKKEGTLHKIGDFLQSSPTLLGSKAKKMMGLVSGRDLDPSGSSPSSLRAKNKRKPYRPEISAPMDMPPHPILSRDPEEGDPQMKRCLRSRVK